MFISLPSLDGLNDTQCYTIIIANKIDRSSETYKIPTRMTCENDVGKVISVKTRLDVFNQNKSNTRERSYTLFSICIMNGIL